MRKLLLRLLTFLRRRRRPDKIMYIGGSDTLPPPLPCLPASQGLLCRHCCC